jgi:hypothetical protein
VLAFLSGYAYAAIVAIEHLDLDAAIPINYEDLPLLITDQLLAEHGDQMEILKRGNCFWIVSPEEA